jgi:hypothetical protein
MVSFVHNHGVTIQDTPPKGRGVIALRDFAPGEVVIVGRAVAVVPERTIYTVQIGVDKHVLLDEPAVLTNHSCTPNAGVRNNSLDGYDFIAMRPIRLGEEITWDYETTEYEIIAVTNCYCGSGQCRGGLRGFRYNSEYIRERYGLFLAEYLIASVTPAPESQRPRGTVHITSSSMRRTAIPERAELKQLKIGPIERRIQDDRTIVSTEIDVAG